MPGTYSPWGNRTSLTLPNAQVTAATFDALNRVTDLHTTDPTPGTGNGATVYRVQHTYDLGGNRRTADEVWNADAAATPGSAWVHKATSYDYDDLYQLTESQYTLTDATSGAPVTTSATDTWTYDRRPPDAGA